MDLSADEKKILLGVARSTIQASLSNLEYHLPETSINLSTQCGAFVTLKAGEELRGCIGRMDASAPLLRVVEAMARAAAFEDPRFPALKSSELPNVSIEISVLTPMRRINDKNEISVGQHGLHMRRGFRSGVFLPQVPVEWGWDRETYLRQLCRKAGLPESALEDPATELSVFEAIVFGERDI
jgi:AmmeMemoRadiSam system protein A